MENMIEEINYHNFWSTWSKHGTMLWMYRDFSRTQPVALIRKKKRVHESYMNIFSKHIIEKKKVFALLHLRNLSRKGVLSKSFNILSSHRCIIRVIYSKIVCNVFATKKVENGFKFSYHKLNKNNLNRESLWIRC